MEENEREKTGAVIELLFMAVLPFCGCWFLFLSLISVLTLNKAIVVTIHQQQSRLG